MRQKLRGTPGSLEMRKMRQTIHSFGFIVSCRQIRLFVLWPGAEEIYICKQLPRQGYWELCKVDRNLWELYGALGIPVFEYATTQEIVKWFYDLALKTPEVMEGLTLMIQEAGATWKHVHRIEGYDRDFRRERERKRAAAKKRRRNKTLREAERKEREQQQKLKDKLSNKEKRRGK